MEAKEPELTINQQNPEDKPVAFFAGRANPPTPGHIKIMIQMLEFASNNDMIPRIYLSSTYNPAGTTNKKGVFQPTKNITHITASGSKLRGKGPYHTHVKHNSYQNPLMPQDKKEIVVKMLYNATNPTISKEELEKIVVVTQKCQPLWGAFSCVSTLQPNTDKVFYFMGKEGDELEAMEREKECKLISSVHQRQDDPDLVQHGVSFYLTHNDSKRYYKCILVSREDDPNNPASGMSGSKIRLLVASKDSIDNQDEASAEFQKVYRGFLNPEQSDDMFDKIKQGILYPSERSYIEEPESSKEGIVPSLDKEEAHKEQEKKKKKEETKKRKDIQGYVGAVQGAPKKPNVVAGVVAGVVVGGRKTRRKKRKGKRKTYKRKHKKNKTKRKKIKRKRKKNLKKRTKKR